jgi:Zn-dependent protease
MLGRSLGYQSYSVTMSRPTTIRFSRIEVIHILVAFCVLTLDFWLIATGANLLGTSMFGYNFSFLAAVPVAALVTATGFVSHEMAHKFSAQRMGLWAEFRMALQWLFLSIMFAFVGFLFAAPGATMVGGWGSKKEAGVTSIAGPSINLCWAAVFLGGAMLTTHFHLHYWLYGYWSVVFTTVALVNLWFAIFNLIPFGPLDGKKVLNWNKGVWAAAFFGAVAVFITLVYIFPQFT